MGKRNLNLELFVVVSWMNSWVSPFIIPDIICFGFFTLNTRMVKFFMKLGVKFHSFFLEKKGEIFVPFTLFEKWKWNENDWKSRSRSESEIKMTRDRDREVKFQKKSREFSRIETLAGHCNKLNSGLGPVIFICPFMWRKPVVRLKPPSLNRRVGRQSATTGKTNKRKNSKTKHTPWRWKWEKKKHKCFFVE